MNKAAIVLKILGILVNVILILLAVPASIINHVSGETLMMVVFVVLSAILNIAALGFARWLLKGACGVVLICLAGVLNVCALIMVIAAICRWGMPPDIISNLAVFALLIFPLITLLALFMVRAELKKPIAIQG